MQENKPDWLEATVGKSTTQTVIGMGGRVGYADNSEKLDIENGAALVKAELAKSMASSNQVNPLKDSADGAIKDALSRFNSASKFAQDDIDRMKHRILEREREVSHYEREIQKLQNMLLAFEYDKMRDGQK